MRTQKGGSLKTLEGFRGGGDNQICLENEDIGGGGRESHQAHKSRGHTFNFVNDTWRQTTKLLI